MRRGLRPRVLVRGLALAPILLVLVKDPAAPIDGAHWFRQTHVAANIEKFLSGGLSLHPATYNLDAPFSLFDFPLYQLAVATLCRSFGSGVLPTARILNVLAFVGLCLVLERLLALAGVRAGERLAGLALFIAAPLNLFYFSNPMVDGLAVLLSFVSLYAFLRWDDAPSPAFGLYALVLVSGALATLIKNPVYLPVCLAIACDRVVRRGFKSLLRPSLVGFGAVIVAAVIGFKLFSNAVNGVGGFFASDEAGEHFGGLGDRLDPGRWEGIAHTVFGLVLNPMTAALGAFGLVEYARTAKSRHRGAFLGLVLGMAVTLLVFFGRNQPHSYYQLPFVFTLAFFASHGLCRVLVRLRAALGRRTPSRALAAALVAAVGLGTLWASVRGYEELAAPATGEMAARGAAIRSWTRADDFVVYLLDSEPLDWNPAYLYFAKREGYNLSRPDLSPSALRRVYDRYSASYGRFFVSCPRKPRVLCRRLEDWGLTLAEAGPTGSLYRMDR